MNKYNKGDKVVLRKDLEIGNGYGNCTWRGAMEYMKESPYVVIDSVDYDGDCYVNKWCITQKMISHKYIENVDWLLKTSEEVSKKYQVGDKVVVRDDLIVSEYYGTNGWAIEMEGMKELPYVILGEDSASGFIVNDYEGDYRITPEMISHKFDDKSPSEIPDHLIEQIEYTPTYPELFSEATTREILINAALDSGDKELFMQLTSDI